MILGRGLISTASVDLTYTLNTRYNVNELRFALTPQLQKEGYQF